MEIKDRKITSPIVMDVPTEEGMVSKHKKNSDFKNRSSVGITTCTSSHHKDTSTTDHSENTSVNETDTVSFVNRLSAGQIKIGATTRQSSSSFLVRFKQKIGKIFQKNINISDNAYRYLARRIEIDCTVTDRGNALMITSPESTYASTISTLMLAYGLSCELGSRVLVIDTSLAQYGVSDYLGHNGENTLLDILSASHSKKINSSEEYEMFFISSVRHTSVNGVDYLPQAPHCVPAPSDFCRNNLSILIGAMCTYYDYVIIQAGCLLSDPRYVQLASVVDSTLVLVIENKTYQSALTDYQRCLDAYRIPNSKLVLLHE